MKSPDKNILFISAVLFICIFLHHDLTSVSNMEARNFITAREILENGSWLLPTMNGELRIAKPPLPTWVTALAMMGAGTDANLTVNRIPAGLCAAMLALFVFLLVKRVTGDTAFAITAMLILATGYLFMWSARKNSWDIYPHVAMAGAIWAMLEAFMRTRGKTLYFFVFSFLMAISFYSKGPVAFWAMLAPFLLSYCIAFGTKDVRKNVWGLLWGLGLCVILSALWPVYVYMSTPHAATAIASQESSAWFTNHTKPLWYYLANLQWIAGIWLFFLLYGVMAPFVRKKFTPQEKLFVFWFLLTIVFLSVIPEKKIRYLFPAVVPGCVVSAMAIYHLRQARGWGRNIVYGAFCMVMGFTFIAAAVALVYLSDGRISTLLSALPIGFTGGVILYQFFTGNTGNTHIAAIVGICLAIVLLVPAGAQYQDKDKTELFMHVREQPDLKEREFYFVGDLSFEIIWAIGKKAPLITKEEIPALDATGRGYALITTEKLAANSSVLRVAETINTGEKTYYIYRSL